MNLQYADFGEFSENLLPFLGGQFAAGAIERERVRAIGALQWTTVGEFGEHRQRNTESFRRRAAGFEHGQTVVDGRWFVIRIRAHEVFSRASVRKPLSARSCSMPMTSVAIASRGAAYLIESWSTRAATLRTPSHSCSTSTAISSGARTRSGARITQTCRVSSNFSRAWRGSFGRLVSLTVMLRGEAIGLLLLHLSPMGSGRRNAPDEGRPFFARA